MNKKMKTSVGFALTIFVIVMVSIFFIGVNYSRNHSSSSLVMLNPKTNTKSQQSKQSTQKVANTRSSNNYVPPVLITHAS